jgi:O-antigen/teichoic acid export membrane protein
MFKKLARNPFLATSALAIVGFNLGNFLHFLANFCLVKALSVELYGEYTATTAYSALLGLPLTIIVLILIKIFGARSHHERQSYLFVFEQRLKLTLRRFGPVMIAVTAIFVWWLSRFSNLTNIFSYFYILAAFAVSITTTIYTGFLQGDRQFTQYYVANICAALFKFSGYLLIYLCDWDLAMAYFFLLGSGCLSLVYQRHQAYRHFQPHIQTKSIQVRPFHLSRFIRRREFWLPAVTMAGLVTFVNGDLIVIKKFAADAQAGLYSVISLFSKMISYALQPVAEVVFSFASARETKRHQQKNLFLTTIFFLLAGVGTTGGYYLLGRPLISIFATSAYLEVAPYLPLAAVFGTSYVLNTLYGKHLIARNQIAGCFSLLLCLGQVGALTFWHQNFWQVLTINITTSVILGGIYFGAALIDSRQLARLEKTLPR